MKKKKTGLRSSVWGFILAACGKSSHQRADAGAPSASEGQSPESVGKSTGQTVLSKTSDAKAEETPPRQSQPTDDRSKKTEPETTLSGADNPLVTPASIVPPPEIAEEVEEPPPVPPLEIVEKEEPPPDPPTPQERPPLPDTTPAGRHAFRFTPDDIPDGLEPTGLTRHLIGGKAWIMPYEGPLELTWAIQDHQTQYVPTIQRAFDIFEAAANIKFIRIDSANFNDAHLKFDYGNVSSGTSALPLDRGVEVSFKHTHGINLHLHEIGHALGLAHPFDERNKWPGDDDYYRSPLTVMSYNREDLPNARLGDADIEALQFLYGAPSTNWQSPERFFDYSQSQKAYSPSEGPSLGGRLASEVISIEENIYPSVAIFDVQAYDSYREAIRFELIDGDRDNHFFRIDEDGLIYFKQSPDYENPEDTSGGAKFSYNNAYEVTARFYFEFNSREYYDAFSLLFKVSDIAEVI